MRTDDASDNMVGLGSSSAGGHPTYVRAHARAARRAGFQPHLFAFGRHDETVETEFGIVHYVPVLLDAAKVPLLRYRQQKLVWRYPVLARAVASFILSNPNAKLIHSFGLFGGVGVVAHDILRDRQIDTIPVMSSYDIFVREASVTTRDDVRGAFGVTDERFVLVTTGGGAFGFSVLDAYVRALAQLPSERKFFSLIIGGPSLPASCLSTPA